ncbi:OLC1v1014965C1 [Oldenlandia corymbosa var. corymbosa]|uniref:OLC1v1014965C1 n=1 Tax=Oldenlandia corymbosa var. corymbosa TaxID=529605 RepID=A0AAV1E5U0_OLDCO|nr:OLC1v1014965C1 [Oldenlandia corymbosa var. corymbosa]
MDSVPGESSSSLNEEHRERKFFNVFDPSTYHCEIRWGGVPPKNRAVSILWVLSGGIVIARSGIGQPDLWLRGKSGFPISLPEIESGGDIILGEREMQAYLERRFREGAFPVFDESPEGIAAQREYKRKFEAAVCGPGKVPFDPQFVSPGTPPDLNDTPAYPKKVPKGMTTLAFLFKKGVIVAADHPRGAVDNAVIPLTRHILATVSGDDVSQGKTLLADLKKCYLGIPVEDAAKLLKDLLSSHGEQGLSLTTMIAGLDRKGRSLYCLDGKGYLCRGVKYATGSGWEIASVNMDMFYLVDMPVKRATELGKRAICRAGYRAKETGGFASGMMFVSLIIPYMCVSMSPADDILSDAFKVTTSGLMVLRWSLRT